MRIPVHPRAIMLAAALQISACTSAPEYPSVSVQALEPADGPEGQATPVQIQGLGFHVVLTSELDETSWEVGSATVTVGGTAVENVVVRSEVLIEGVVAATTPVGVHEVVVTFADGRNARLADGFEVYGTCVDAADCDDGDPCTTSERCDEGSCFAGPADKDEDGDSFVDIACGGDDCDDSSAGCGAGCFPGNSAPDICDGADQDCDGVTDEDNTCGDGGCCSAAGEDIVTCEADCSGVIVDDPFGDGTAFTYITAFDGMVYFGPSADGASAVRTEPDGSAPQSVELRFSEDTTGNVSRNGATAPYTSIGYTGCSSDTLDCGPDNEDGRGFFTSALLGGTQWLVVGGARVAGDLDYVYLTSGSAAPLLFRYVDMSFTMGPQSRGFSAAHAFNDRLYLGFPDTGGARPYLLALIAPPLLDPGLDATAAEVLNVEADNMPGLKTVGTAIIDSLIDFNARLYVANSGGWVRSTTDTPDSAEAAPGDWVSHLPSAAEFSAKSAVTTAKTSDLEPTDKAVPQMAVFGGRLYAARNTTDGPQLWSCNPGVSGSALDCDSGDWSLIASNSVGDLQLSQFDNPANTSIGALVATPTHLYVAFDNTASGVVVFRSTVATPTARSDFEGDGGCPAEGHPATCDGLAGNGLGDPTNTRVFFGVALTFGPTSSVYLAIGSGIDGVRIYRL